MMGHVALGFQTVAVEAVTVRQRLKKTQNALFTGALCLSAACGATSAARQVAEGATASCSVTRAPSPAFVPPAPYLPEPPAERAGYFWYGTPSLWTMLRGDGTWSDLPGHAGGYTQKIFWWREGYRASDEPQPALAISGRRLDGASEALVASRATNASGAFGEAMLVGVTLPSAGCWQITGSYSGQELTFVVLVEP
jgi:hypothetical protein